MAGLVVVPVFDPPIPVGLCQCGCGRETPRSRQGELARGYVRGEPMTCVVGHKPARPLAYEEIDLGHDSPCWVWRRAVCTQGYAQTRFAGRRHRAHRVAYELFVGPIPEGMVLDHVCHTESNECEGGTDCLHRRCINPAHLEVVTQRENRRRSKQIPWNVGTR